MATQILRPINSPTGAGFLRRWKTSSAEYVASRSRDPTFEKLMEKYKNLLKVFSIQDLILASTANPPSVSLNFLNRLSQRLRLNRGAASFLRKYPHIFDIFSHGVNLSPHCRLTPAAFKIIHEESEAIKDSIPEAVTRLVKLLSMSPTKKVPLRGVFKIWRELGLPDEMVENLIQAEALN